MVAGHLKHFFPDSIPMHTVTVYSTPTCPYCKMAKKFLSDHDVAYTDIDVAADDGAAQKMIEKSEQMGVPVIVVADPAGKETVIIGFDQKKLSTVLGIS